MEEILTMSTKELERHDIIKKVIDKKITQKQAAELLKLSSDRQIRNLLSSYKEHGLKGLISKQRGKPSNRKYSSLFKDNVMAIVHERYPDFGPTLAKEKLREYHDISISKETLRKWMVAEHLWVSRKQKRKIHPSRERREFFGEMIQVDASFHLWFEDRADKCALIVFIDDATSKITSLYFCPRECLEGYFIALRQHIMKHGRPLAIYSDKHAIFGGSDKIHHAQFIRAMNELDIESILASSPQAKGRVERVNQTLQDRLIKEMRLRNICSIEDANKYLLVFIEEFNKKFSKEPRGQIDAHRPLASGCDLERILTRCETRTLSKDLSFSFHSTMYQIMESSIIERLKGKQIEIRGNRDRFQVYFNDKELKYLPLSEIDRRELDYKEKLDWKPRERYHPGMDHPWKRKGYQHMERQQKMKQSAVMV